MKNQILYFNKIKASSLYFALVIVLISSLFLAALLNLFEWDKKRQHVLQSKRLAQQHINEAWDVATHPNTIYPSNGQFSLSLFPNNISLLKQNYGLFQSIIVTDSLNKLVKAGLLSNHNSNDSLALYLENVNSPLALVGKTRIVGPALVSERSVKRGNVGQTGYNGENLIQGELIISDGTLPNLDEDLVVEIQQLISNLQNLDLSNSIFEFENVETNSFLVERRFIVSPSALYIENTIKGNLVVIAPQIIISPNSNIEDAIFVSKEIIVQQGSQLSAQLIATDKIDIEPQVEMSFPSAIALFSQDSSKLAIGANSRIEGLVIHNNSNPLALTEIEEAAVIQGQLYSTAVTELKGKIWGSTFVKDFVLRTPSTIYKNYLLDAEINRINQSPYMQVSALPNDVKQNRRTVKWLE